MDTTKRIKSFRLHLQAMIEKIRPEKRMRNKH